MWVLRDTYTATKHHKRNGRCYLQEWRTYRRDGKVVSEYVRYLGLCPEHSPKGTESVLDRTVHGSSYRAGAVRLLWWLAQDFGVRTAIDGICGRDSDPSEPSPGRTLTAWAFNRVLDPKSATRLELWTPTTDLPIVTGVPAEVFAKDTFLRALDRVCFEDPNLAAVVVSGPDGEGAARQDGKYVRLCTGPRLSAREVVEEYLGKDFVEKAFRTWKSGIEVEPVRHRRVRAYLFVCSLAYRLEIELRWKLLEGGVKPEEVTEYQERLLEELERVVRPEVRLGAQARTWYLNVTGRIRGGLRRLRPPDMLREGPVASSAART